MLIDDLMQFINVVFVQVKQSMGDEKKLIRQIKDHQDGELRQVTSQVKIDYKKAKQQLKQVCVTTYVML